LAVYSTHFSIFVVAKESKDIAYEEDILRDPHSLKNWWYYLDFKADAPQEVRSTPSFLAMYILTQAFCVSL
jgi:hypothetical protein